MTTVQCLGTTKRGTRCLKRVSNGEWCNYHQSQNPIASKLASNSLRNVGTPRPNAPVKNWLSSGNHSSPALNYTHTHQNQDAIQAGYIYVYTLSSFLHGNSTGGWIQARNLVDSKRTADKWVDINMRRLKLILIKVGMTTKTPEIRILQWEEKCHHKLTCLYPLSHSFKKTSLLDLFKNLSLKSKSPLLTFKKTSKGFYASKNLGLVEKQVHHTLKSKFGRGEIQCTGCIEENKAQKKNQNKNTSISYNIHNEWFPVPKSKIEEVFYIINEICLLHSKI